RHLQRVGRLTCHARGERDRRRRSEVLGGVGVVDDVRVVRRQRRIVTAAEGEVLGAGIAGGGVAVGVDRGDGELVGRAGGRCRRSGAQVEGVDAGVGGGDGDGRGLVVACVVGGG